MKFVFFLQTLNLHPNKHKYKSKQKKTLYFKKKILNKSKNKKRKQIYFSLKKKCCNNLQ